MNMKLQEMSKYTKVIQNMIVEVEQLTGEKFEDLGIEVMTKDEVYAALAEIRETLPANQRTLLDSLDYADTDLEECQYWTGGKTTDGYGLSTRSPQAEGTVPGATVMNAQRRVKLLAKGEEALLEEPDARGKRKRKHVDHGCHVAGQCPEEDPTKCTHRICVNLGHLAVMPARINIWKSKKPKCSWGHRMEIEGVDYRVYGTSRHCIECGRRADQMHKAVAKAKRAVQRAETNMLVANTPELVDIAAEKLDNALIYRDYIVAYVETSKRNKVWVKP